MIFDLDDPRYAFHCSHAGRFLALSPPLLVSEMIKLEFVGGRRLGASRQTNRKRETRKSRRKILRSSAPNDWPIFHRLSNRRTVIWTRFLRTVLSADTRDSSNLVKSTDNCGNGFVPLFFPSCLLDSLMGAVVFRFLRLLRFTDDPMKSIFIGLRDFSVKHRTTVISNQHTRRLYQNFQVKIRVVERGQAFRGTLASCRI